MSGISEIFYFAIKSLMLSARLYDFYTEHCSVCPTILIDVGPEVAYSAIKAKYTIRLPFSNEYHLSFISFLCVYQMLL